MMKVRRLTIDVLYDDVNEDDVEICLDKMTTDWLIRPEVESYDTALSDPQDPDTDKWDYFWAQNELTGEWYKIE